MKRSLISLTLGGLSLGMTEFMMMGVLPDVSNSLHISIPTAGYLISAYALGVVIGAPLMAGLTRKYAAKNILIGLMIMFAVFNALFALSPNYILLFVTRLLSGLPHGAFFGVGAVVASRLAEPGKKAQAVALMFAGLTIANIVGVPIGTYIGHNFSWRLSFMIVALFGLITALAVKKWMPLLEDDHEQNSEPMLSAFKKLEVWLIIGVSTIGTGGLFAWISYIAPLMTEVAHFESNSITFIMIIAGLGMAAGNLIGGRLADKYSPLRTTALLLLGMISSLLIVSVIAEYKVLTIIMTFITGAIAFAVIAPMQMLMINAAKGSEMIASSALQASANMGNALGAFLGGLPIAAGLGYTSPMYVGALLATCGFIITLVIKARNTHLRKLDPQPVVLKN
ncbi:MFS transporter [Chryseosolibacter indicus]|uniref:MFS transporter n=1 Tax=Chryseosolibacter indicus TaxID=2782351 RepID=A0ABS5VSU2_9BACT|nr:MFS transporter [Chryseosolibacter indicus]MBT1704499.1 MFS transporter [Chryseosolibacter indicus]